MIIEALMCLAMNAYWEARNQSTEGMIAVSQVVMNRVESDHYPNDVCSVIKQGPHRASWQDPSRMIPLEDKCQFSWYCDGKSDQIPRLDQDIWEKALVVSEGVLKYKIDNIVGKALWYHADYVVPAWASQKRMIIKIDDHIFYGWKYKPKGNK
tara:strand:+ start:752 stop:1210 length:459 start_codon:yes stop_codon:yes gene_type:complete